MFGYIHPHAGICAHLVAVPGAAVGVLPAGAAQETAAGWIPGLLLEHTGAAVNPQPCHSSGTGVACHICHPV